MNIFVFLSKINLISGMNLIMALNRQPRDLIGWNRMGNNVHVRNYENSNLEMSHQLIRYFKNSDPIKFKKYLIFLKNKNRL